MASPQPHFSLEHYLAEASRLLESGQSIVGTLRQMTVLLVPPLADWCVVWSIDQKGVWHPLASAHRDAARQHRVEDYANHVPYSDVETTEQRAVRTREPATVMAVTSETGDVELSGDARYRDLLRALAPQSLMALPFVARARVVGAMVMASTQPERPYAGEDLRRAEQLAVPYALALDNAQLFTQQERLRTRLQVAYDVTSLLLRRRPIEETGGELLRLVGERLAWDVGVLWIGDLEAGTVQRVATWHADDLSADAYQALQRPEVYRTGDGIVGRTLGSGEAQWLADLTDLDDTTPERAWAARDAGLRAALFLPLTGGGGGARRRRALQPAPQSAGRR